MNYRHNFHAGNFADVVKHAVLALIARHFVQKATPFRYIDTHAGLGVYDLYAEQARKTGEWREGVGRVWGAKFTPDVAELLAPWRAAVDAVNTEGALRFYPGSPEIVRHLARRDDRLILCELHPQDASALEAHYARDRRVRAIAIDGWTGLNAYVPPKERRGIVLVDPPFEEDGELARMAAALERAHQKWPTGTYVLWYPIKDIRDTNAFLRRLREGGIPSILSLELMIQSTDNSARLGGTGLVVVNPPWTLERDARRLLPALAGVLGRDEHAGFRVQEIAPERSAART